MLCLNVAINSYDNALLSLLMSNQFVEIKGSVFKKFEKDNLFQITCAGPLILILLLRDKCTEHFRQISWSAFASALCFFSLPFAT